jgi:hypothetical protein
MADTVTALDRDVTTLEGKLEAWEVACRPNVADEVTANELERVRQENSRGGIPLATEAALEHYEDEWRTQYDRARRAEATVLDIETDVLRAAIADAITAAETLPSERRVHGTTSEKGLLAAVLEETVAARLAREWPTMTIADLDAAYASWTDEGDRTAVRLVEQALTAGGLSRLGLKPEGDATREALAVQALQRRVAERRRARVPAGLYEQASRVAKLWTLPRAHLRGHFAEGRGIAKRPRPSLTVRIGGGAA